MPRGGRRPGAGRPKGAFDRFFRGAREKTRTMQEAEQYLRTNNMATFEGDSLALLVSIYRNEVLPLNIRFNAAVAASPFENPKMSDARILVLEKRQQELTAEQQQAQIDAGDARLDALIEQWNEFTADREEEISALLATGDITPKAAEAIRRWHLPPERPLLPPPTEPELANITDNTDAPQPPAAPTARSAPAAHSNYDAAVAAMGSASASASMQAATL